MVCTPLKAIDRGSGPGSWWFLRRGPVYVPAWRHCRPRYFFWQFGLGL